MLHSYLVAGPQIDASQGGPAFPSYNFQEVERILEPFDNSLERLG